MLSEGPGRAFQYIIVYFVQVHSELALSLQCCYMLC